MLCAAADDNADADDGRCVHVIWRLAGAVRLRGARI